MAGRAPDNDERFLTFARTIPDGLFVIDGESRIVFVNEAIESMFGYEPGALTGKPVSMLLPEDAYAQHLAVLDSLADSADPSPRQEPLEVSALRRDGSELPLEVSYGTYAEGRERFFTGVVRDVSQLRRAEERLRFQARLLDAVGEAVIATDLDGRILYWNAYAEQLYRWRAEEVVGRQITDVTPTELSRASSHEIMERLRQGETWTGEFHVQDREGREFPVLVTDSPVENAEGELVGIIGTSKEITDRKRSEEAQRFLAEAGRVLAWSLDQATTLSRVSRLAVPLLGEWCVVQLSAEGELVPVEHCTPEGKESEGHELVELLTGEEGILSRLRPGSEPLRLRVSDAPMEDPEGRRLGGMGIAELLVAPLEVRGEPLGLMAFARGPGSRSYDSDDANLASELALRAASAIENARLYRDAEESNRAKTDFLAVVSHELRTPLNAIMGYADLLTGGVSGELNERQKRQVERVKVGAGHLAHLIDEILAYARVEAGREEVDLQPVDVGKVARDAVVVIQPSAQEKGLEVQVDVPESGPDLLSDAGKIRQILVNLLSNAVKYTEEGHVRVVVRPESDGVVLSVSDTGVGIPAEEHERIFEPFRQVQSPNTRSIGGTGLGLSVNRRLVDLLGGTISVDSAPGEGSTFTVRLPTPSADAPPTSSGRS